MKVSAAFLERSAGETGFQPAILEKVIRLGALANEITRHPLLGNALLLKGGTALNLGFGPPGRLSVDLDFNYVGALDREVMLAERPGIEAALESLCDRLGFRVQRSADAFAGRSYYLGYPRTTGGTDRIEIDLNFLFRSPIGDPVIVELWQPGGLDHLPARVVSLDELCIGKLLAMLDRTAPRDAWDVTRLPNIAGATLNSSGFRERLIALSIVLTHPIDSYHRDRFAERLTARSISENLWPMLSGGQRPAADDLLQSAWEIVKPFLALSEEEAAFLRSAQRGEFRPDLLGQTATVVVELANHPAIKWKLGHIRKRLRQ